MTVSSATSSTTPTFLTKLETKGLSADKAKLVGDDLVTAVQQVADANGGVATDDKVRDVLDKRIADDVASGKLSKDDAAKVSKTLDQMEGISDDDASASDADDGTALAQASGAQGAGGAGGGGGGGGGSETKTELSRTITVSGSVKTTTITYTDGTSDTTTAVASASDEAKYGKKSQAADTDDATAQSYLAGIEPGSLVNKTA